MAPRLIAHVGFHKTGTSSVQKTLKANKDVLAGHLHIGLRQDMLALCETTRAWSASRDPVDLAYVHYEAADMLTKWKDDTPMLLSSEDLSGHMPGRRGLTTYDAAPALAEALVAAWSAVRPDADITLVYTTRAAEPWLRSCYGQHLRATRIRMSERHYADAFQASADLNGIVEHVRAKCTDATVADHALEDARDLRLGPLDPILDLIGLSETVRRTLRALPPANVALSQSDRDAMLALNRSDLRGNAYDTARTALKKGRR